MADKKDFIKFLGTGGARFVVSKQLRSTGGLWCSFASQNICIDPGPGTLVRCFETRPILNPEFLDAIILTHPHLDHSCDANVMVEAMTKGTFRKNGVFFAPNDAINNEEPVVFRYLREAVAEVNILEAGQNYNLGKVSFSCPVKHNHAVDTYGLVFKLIYGKIAFIVDTRYFSELINSYQADILIINVVLYEHPQLKRIKHLDVRDVEKIIREIKPKAAIITHFGTPMLDAGPELMAQILTQATGIKVIAAQDDMTIYPEELIKE